MTSQTHYSCGTALDLHQSFPVDRRGWLLPIAIFCHSCLADDWIHPSIEQVGSIVQPVVGIIAATDRILRL